MSTSNDGDSAYAQRFAISIPTASTDEDKDSVLNISKPPDASHIRQTRVREPSPNIRAFHEQLARFAAERDHAEVDTETASERIAKERMRLWETEAKREIDRPQYTKLGANEHKRRESSPDSRSDSMEMARQVDMAYVLQSLSSVKLVQPTCDRATSPIVFSDSFFGSSEFLHSFRQQADQVRAKMPDTIAGDETAFDYAVRPFLATNLTSTSLLSCSDGLSEDNPPSTAHSFIPPTHTSFSLPTCTHTPFQRPSNPIKHSSPLENRLAHLHASIRLLRCTILFQTARSHAQHPYMGPHPKPPSIRSDHRAFLLIDYFSESALHVAERLADVRLQARAWYWRGKALGCLRCWGDARAAFAKAMRLDKEANMAGERGSGSEGLRIREKAELRALLEGVEGKERGEEDERRGRERWDEERAWKVADARRCFIDDVWVRSESPAWAPEVEDGGVWELQWVPGDTDELLEWRFSPFTEEERKYIVMGDRRASFKADLPVSGRMGKKRRKRDLPEPLSIVSMRKSSTGPPLSASTATPWVLVGQKMS